MMIQGIMRAGYSVPADMPDRVRWLRAFSIVLVSMLVLGGLWATVQLIDDLTAAAQQRAPQTSDPAPSRSLAEFVSQSRTFGRRASARRPNITASRSPRS
jgi:hypothetical protein